MKINKVILLLIILTICSTSVAFGFVMGKTNFELTGYPEFNKKHYRPSKPYSQDSYSMQKYRMDMEEYIQYAKDYNEAANNDIQRIQESVEKTRIEVNDAIDEYNRFVKYGY